MYLLATHRGTQEKNGPKRKWERERERQKEKSLTLIYLIVGEACRITSSSTKITTIAEYTRTEHHK